MRSTGKMRSIKVFIKDEMAMLFFNFLMLHKRYVSIYPKYSE